VIPAMRGSALELAAIRGLRACQPAVARCGARTRRDERRWHRWIAEPGQDSHEDASRHVGVVQGSVSGTSSDSGCIAAVAQSAG
jgi:hypothetical protein